MGDLGVSKYTALFSDKRYIEQIVFNLFSDSIKYSYLGTNICVDCSLSTRDKEYQILTVRDYGTSIPKGHQIYDLYFRDDNNEDLLALNAQGSGIGLYVVKKICELLDLSYDHTCKLITNIV